MAPDVESSLIITIVKKGWGEKVIEASCGAGAKGATIVFGRGVGIHEQQKLLGIAIEPEKEIVFTVTERDKAEAIMDEIVRAAELDKPGRGIGFIIPVQKVVGMSHILSDEGKQVQQEQCNLLEQQEQHDHQEQPG